MFSLIHAHSHNICKETFEPHAAALILFLLSHNFRSIPGIIRPRPSAWPQPSRVSRHSGTAVETMFYAIPERRALANKLFILLRPT